MYYKTTLLLLAYLIVGSHQEDVESNLKFRLSTSYDREGLRVFPPTLVERNVINVLKRVIIIIPDFVSNLNEHYDELRNAFFEKDNYNIFTVEKATDENDVKTLGEDVANFLAELIEKTGEKFLDIHLIGYSKGAEIASYAGRTHTEKQGRKLGRITALNPVSDQGGVSAITATDANFVDVTHTDVANGVEGGDLGQIDFYPNGGRNQPSCRESTCETTRCDGVRSVDYFAKSVNSDEFKAVNCPSWDKFTLEKCGDKQVVFGENVDRTASGTFYFKT